MKYWDRRHADLSHTYRRPLLRGVPLPEESFLNPSRDLVNRLWRLCSLLRKDGITYQQYVVELAYLLFLKMTHESDLNHLLPKKASWSRLTGASAAQTIDVYKDVLSSLSDAKPSSGLVARIFDGAGTSIRESENLAKLIEHIDQIGWFSENRDSFGDLYEGILERNAEETKRGAGQYFTPRVLVEAIVDLMQPRAGEIVQDPAAGTGGFLISAAQYARHGAGACTLVGMENVPGTYQLLLMNLFLHGFDADGVQLGDTLSDDGRALCPSDVILTNPPFGPAGGRPTRSDLAVTGTVSSFAPPFVEHCIRSLKPGGRAAVVVPDSVLYEEGRGKALRTFLMKECELHTILRLPSGIFYAQNVKTNVIFFNRRSDGVGTAYVWYYDLRTDMPAFSKSIPLAQRHFDEFTLFYGGRPDGSDRPEDGSSDDNRARRFSRTEIQSLNDNLDITWLREDDAVAEHATEPDEMIAAVAGYLSQALDEVKALAEELDRSTQFERRAGSR